MCPVQARCFERENESLECQIVELEEQLNGQPAAPSVTSTVAQHDYSLDAVVERLRKERVSAAAAAAGCVCCVFLCASIKFS